MAEGFLSVGDRGPHPGDLSHFLIVIGRTMMPDLVRGSG